LVIEAEVDERKRLMLGAARYRNDDEHMMWAILVYGVYMTTNTARRHLRKDSMAEEIKQHCRQATDGHIRTATCLSRRWARPPGG
jgi:hypothetical protein